MRAVVAFLRGQSESSQPSRNTALIDPSESVRWQSIAIQAFEAMPAARRTLAAWPDDEAAQLGLFGRERPALVFQQTYHEHLVPRLRVWALL